MTLTKDSLICLQCYYFLKNIERFRAKCIEVQKKLINYNCSNLCSGSDSWRENYVYSSKGINKGDEISHTYVPVRSTEVNRSRSETPDCTTTNNKERSPSLSSYSSNASPKKVKVQTKLERSPSIEVIEINDNEVELKIAENCETGGEEADDIFTEEADEDVVIVKEEEIQDVNPRYVVFIVLCKYN